MIQKETKAKITNYNRIYNESRCISVPGYFFYYFLRKLGLSRPMIKDYNLRWNV